MDEDTEKILRGMKLIKINDLIHYEDLVVEMKEHPHHGIIWLCRANLENTLYEVADVGKIDEQMRVMFVRATKIAQMEMAFYIRRHEIDDVSLDHDIKFKDILIQRIPGNNNVHIGWMVIDGQRFNAHHQGKIDMTAKDNFVLAFRKSQDLRKQAMIDEAAKAALED